MRSLPQLARGATCLAAAATLLGCPDFVRGTPVSEDGGAGGGPAEGGGGQGAASQGGGGDGGGGAMVAFDGPALVPSGRGDSNGFGSAVAVSDASGTPTVLVGADGEDASAAGSGAAYVFVRGSTGWTEEQRLLPDDTAANQLFGSGVALHGDTALVGAPGANAAYVFVRNGTTWSQQAKLVSADAGAWYVGEAVALVDDVAIVSDTLHFLDGTGQVGAAYVFERSGVTWSETARLMDADPEVGANFGWSLAFDGTTAVVGAPSDDEASVDSGSAVVFTTDGSQWSAPEKLVPSSGVNDDQFGFDVDVDGDTVVVGAHRHDVAADISGAAYVFVRRGSSWSEQSLLAPGAGGKWHYFGDAVAVRGDRILGGAPGVDGKSDVNLGAAYLFVRQRGAWGEQLTLTPLGPSEEDFGASLSFGQTYAAIGAPRGRGRVYIWPME